MMVKPTPSKAAPPWSACLPREAPHEASRHTNTFEVTARCAVGYKGHAKVTACTQPETTYTLTGCEPKKCVEPREVEMTSYDLSVYSLEVPSFSVSAKCKTKMMHGMKPRAISCTEDGDEFSLEGCVPGQCLSPDDAVNGGYVVYEASMIVNAFKVTAKCASGYKGTAVVSVCKDVDETYSLSGCTPEVCTEPSEKDADGYELKPYSLERPHFSVAVKCKSGIGFGKAKECTKDGEPYTVEGCYLGDCLSPRKGMADGYVVYETSKMRHNFDVKAKCASGYKGDARVTECRKADEPYTVSGCIPETCVEPSAADRANYVFTTYSLERPSFSVTARCKWGFAEAKATECTEDGGAFSLHGCKDACASPRKSAQEGYTVFEEKMILDGFKVEAICADDYEGTATVTKCPATSEPYTLSGCSPIKCTEPSDEDQAAYALTVFSKEAPSFSVTAQCKNGVGTGKAVKCKKSGQPFTLEGCPSLCTSPKRDIQDGYSVFEKSMLMKDFHVHAICADDYKGTASVVKCTAVNTPYTLTGCVPEKCIEPSDEEKTNYDIATFSLERPSFSVSVKCKDGSAGAKATRCTSDNQAYKLEGCDAVKS